MKPSLLAGVLLMACSRSGAVVWGTESDAGEDALSVPESDASVELPEATQPEAGCERNACGECAPPLLEECNGRDDNCDGRIDENCSQLWPELRDASAFRLLGEGALALVGTSPQTGKRVEEGRVLVWTAGPGQKFVVLNQEPSSDAGSEGFTLLQQFDRDSAWITAFGTNGILAKPLHPDAPFWLTDGPRSERAGLAVDSGRIVFGDNGKLSIWEPPGNKPRRLTQSKQLESAPDVSGEHVVFERSYSKDAEPEVVVCTLDGIPLDVPSYGLSGAHSEPQISGNRVVWTRSFWDAAQRDNVYEAWFYDLETRARRLLSTGRAPHVNGDRVCFHNNGVWLFDIPSGKVTRVSSVSTPWGTRAGWIYSCDVSGDRVAWLGPSGVAYRDLKTEEL